MSSNFNNTTPSAPAGSLNVSWQTDGGGNDSAYVVAPFDVPVFAPGVGTNNQKLLRVKLARAVKFPSGAANSQATASAASTGAPVFTFSKNGSSFATVTYTASATGVWAQASDSTFAAGDLLEVDGPATADGTLADVGMTLFGYRT